MSVIFDIDMPKACVEYCKETQKRKDCPIYNSCRQRDTINLNSKPDSCPLHENEDTIKVGDEVVYHEHTKGVAVRVMLDCHEPYYVLCANGGMMIRTNRQSLEKTGRHFPQIAEVLEQMKGENE